MTTTKPIVRKRPKLVKPSEAEAESEFLSANERILLESACIDAIGKLEHLLARSAFEVKEGYLGESALIGNQILAALVRFAEGNLEGRRLTVVYELADEAYKATKKTVDLAMTQTFGAVRRLIGRETASDADVALAHHEAGQAIAMAALASLGGGIRMLEDETGLARELYASLQPVLAELRENW